MCPLLFRRFTSPYTFNTLDLSEAGSNPGRPTILNQNKPLINFNGLFVFVASALGIKCDDLPVNTHLFHA